MELHGDHAAGEVAVSFDSSAFTAYRLRRGQHPHRDAGQ